jgi:hypothetical protein
MFFIAEKLLDDKTTNRETLKNQEDTGCSGTNLRLNPAPCKLF